MKITNLLKKLPIDLGQAEMKEKSKGKVIGFSYIPDGSGKNALDIGCRDGYWSKKIQQKGYLVESIDIEPHYELAKKLDEGKTKP